MSQLAKGSRVAYDTAWRQWCLFCKARKRDLYLWVTSCAERQADEELLLEYVVRFVPTMKRHPGTVKNKLMAIRHQHILRGIPDPL